MVDQSTKKLLRKLNELGIRLWIDEGTLRAKASKGTLTDALRSQIGLHKDSLISLLSTANQTLGQEHSLIQPALRTEPVPLSFVQQSLWLLEQIQIESAAYNEIGAVQIKGDLQIGSFEQALAHIVERHEVLRTTFTTTAENKPIQIINAPNFSLSTGELNQLLPEQIDQEIQMAVKAEAQSIFDLERGPLFRAKLFRIPNHTDDLARSSEPSHLLVIATHHLISDFWSMGLLLQELSTLYSAFVAGKPSPLPPLRIQYADYAIWQREAMLSDVLNAQLAYWKEHLVAAPTLLQLPTDHPRPPRQTFQGGSIDFTISKSCTQQLQTLAQQTDSTPFMVLLAAFNVLLSRYSRQEDIVIGSPIANRQRSEVESLIGFFANTIVFRTLLHGNPTFVDVLRQVKEVTQNAYAHQDVSFDSVVSAVQPERNPSYSPLFQVMFAFQNVPTVRQLELPGLTMAPMQLDLGISKYDLSLELHAYEGGLSGSFEYSTDIFDRTTIERMVGHFQILVQAIVDNPSQPISRVPMLTDAEYHQIVHEWNDTAVNFGDPQTIHALFERQAERTPDAVATVFEDEQLSYHQLNARANQLAHHLIELGVKAETLVAVAVERSVEMVVSLLAVLKAGGAYVPIDPTYPEERIRYMLTDCAAPILLTQSHLSLISAEYSRHVDGLKQSMHVIEVDTMTPALDAKSTANPQTPAFTNDLAYVIYTSGSAGRPKGVLIEHGGAFNVAMAQAEVIPDLTTGSRLLQMASLSFDAATYELMLALMHGVTLVLPTRHERVGNALTELLQQQRITHVILVPSVLQTLPKVDLPHLKVLITAGEACPEALVNQWGTGRHFFNFYGPTESPIWTTYASLQPEQPEQPVHIGQPIPSRQVYILDDIGGIVPTGVAGELHIGGTQLARGYLNRPELTAERFIDHPKFGRLYKTGDLCRWLSGGNVEFQGRTDLQVKLRGFRIELGEIENVLLAQEGVREALVLVREESGDKRLVAYVTACKGQVADEEPATCNLQPATLRQTLAQQLPDYMIPSTFVFLDAMPLTPNGKLDRRALPTPEYIDTQSEFISPQTATEKALATLFESILKVEGIGIHDDFFALGGHSLLLTQLSFQLRENFQADCSLQDLYIMPTVAQLAYFIDSEQQEKPNRQMLDLNAEAILDPTIRPAQAVSGQTAAEPEYTKPASIFLTGATGFLGAFLLYELLSQTQANILCLVRSMDEQDGISRLQSNLEQYGLWQAAYRERVRVIPGDLSNSLFGLDPEQFDTLAAKIDVIYHNAAIVNFIQPYETLKPINVLGVQDVIRLATQNSFATPIHYVSTIGVFHKMDSFDGRRFHEEHDLGTGLDLGTGYAQSKWVAEKLMLDGRKRGIPVTVYRPGIIGGQSQTGVWNAQDMLPLLLNGWTQLGGWAESDLGVRLAPVDYVSSAIVTLSLQPTNQNSVFHLESPHPLQYRQFVQWLKEFGYSIQEMSVDTWLERLTEVASDSSANSLTLLLLMFGAEGPDIAQSSATDFFKIGRSPQVDCSNTLAGLAHTDIACPRVDAKLFHSYISNFVRTGFFEAPSKALSSKHVATYTKDGSTGKILC